MRRSTLTPDDLQVIDRLFCQASRWNACDRCGPLAQGAKRASELVAQLSAGQSIALDPDALRIGGLVNWALTHGLPEGAGRVHLHTTYFQREYIDPAQTGGWATGLLASACRWVVAFDFNEWMWRYPPGRMTRGALMGFLSRPVRDVELEALTPKLQAVADAALCPPGRHALIVGECAASDVVGSRAKPPAGLLGWIGLLEGAASFLLPSGEFGPGLRAGNPDDVAHLRRSLQRAG